MDERRAAYREAGHVEAHVALRHTFASVSIVPMEGSEGRVTQASSTEDQRENREGSYTPATCRWWAQEIIVSMAGQYAEQRADYEVKEGIHRIKGG